jgi:deoxycytidylate deaminase
MQDILKATNMLFQETGKYIIIGLTGRTGSGCTTSAKILSNQELYIPEKSNIYNSDNEKRKYKIVSGFIRENWSPFYCVQIRAIITELILRLSYDGFVDLVANVMKIKKERVADNLSSFKHKYENASQRVISFNALNEKEEKEKKKTEALELYLKYLPGFCEDMKNELKSKINVNSYTDLYQKVGDNIRASGAANLSVFDEVQLFAIPKIINQIIKAIKWKYPIDGACIVIDAIRNPFEAIYFQQRYSEFYLFAINTPSLRRLDHLRKTHGLNNDQIKCLDEKEYPEKLSGKDIYISQNIQKCIEIADIHVSNPNRSKYNNDDLASQLIWYISLIKHPGLVTPTSVERCMQLAYTAKLNSGCISRQVGAVLTDSNYSVKAVGWNSTPEGQVPCVLRNAKELLSGGDELVYSEYERNSDDYQEVVRDTFNSVISSKELKGRNFSYCFKDLQNEVDGEKNQVHTRSLHAEENAFLQISKYGGSGIKGGILFSTASPCELCSKKAYQLGISKVVYIDPYPGISKEHIITVGINIPRMALFSGAIGRAYHKLYQPIMPYKDELKMLTGFTISGGRKKNKKDLKIKQLEKELESYKNNTCQCKSE